MNEKWDSYAVGWVSLKSETVFCTQRTDRVLEFLQIYSFFRRRAQGLYGAEIGYSVERINRERGTSRGTCIPKDRLVKIGDHEKKHT